MLYYIAFQCGTRKLDVLQCDAPDRSAAESLGASLARQLGADSFTVKSFVEQLNGSSVPSSLPAQDLLPFQI